MTLLGVMGILLGLLGWRFAIVKHTRLRVAVFALLYLEHLAATLAYYLFSANNVTDATGYYHDWLNFYHEVGFGLSTLFVIYVVQYGREVLGGTLLDYFLLFQTLGFFGICFLMRTLEEVYAEAKLEPPLYSYALLFLPGLHFWTSPIGKDGALFLGVCLAIWAMMNVRARYKSLFLAILIMLLFRPHIAAMAAGAVSATMLFDRRTPLLARLGLVAASGIGLVYAALTASAGMSIDLTDADSVSEFLTIHGEVTQISEVAGGSAVYGSFPFKLMSLLFRPFFIDAEDMLGYAASSENLILLLLVAGIFYRWREVVQLFQKVAFVRFAMLLAFLLICFLTFFYYNIGLGLRQKTMFVPALIVIFIASTAVRKARALTPAGGRAVTGMVHLDRARSVSH